MKRKKKSKGSVFRQLVTSYILFAVLSVVTLYLCMFGVLFFLGGGDLDALAPYEMVDDEGNVGDIRYFTRIGGWIEKLDSDFRLVEVYGEKKDSVQSYTMEELAEYLCTDHMVETETSAREYRGFLKSVQMGTETEQTDGGTKPSDEETMYSDGETVWYLMKISRKELLLTYSYNVGVSSPQSGIVVMAFLLFGVLFLINCALMSAYLSRKIKRPLSQLTEGMEQVKQGASMVRLDFQAQKEFEEIRDSFNLMIRQLEEEKREKQINEEKKNRMLLELSHDIKTPVATIKGCANALEEGLVKTSEIPRYYQIIDRKAGRVNTLANEMFLMLKLEDTHYELQTERTDLCELARQISAEFYEEITGQELDFRIKIPETPVYADIDRKEFTRVIENLLGNVVKYNQTGTMAEVEVRQEGGMAKISVRDDGSAVAEDIRSVLFDPFVRGDKARQSRGGTGLGLAIAYKIVEKQGGTLTYQRVNEENEFKAEVPCF